MSELEKSLIGFRRRVRWMRAWKGLAIGGTLGGVISVVLAALDYFRVFYSSQIFLAIPVIAGLVTGAVIGFFVKVKTEDLADSIDRRATLENRLGTASEEAHDDMRELQREDALAHLQSLKPAAVYPVKMSRWHGGAIVLYVLAASVLLLGNMPAFKSEATKKEQEELKENAKQIERVAKPMLERKPDEINPEAKEIAKKMDELKREMERGRMPKEEAMQKANKLAEEAQKTAKEQAEKSEMAMDTAEKQLEKMAQNDAMKELGLKEEDLEKGDLETATQQSEADRQQMTKDLKDQLKKMQAELGMSQKNSQNKDGKPQSEKDEMKQLQEQMNDLESQLKSGMDSKGNKLSKEQMEKLQKLMDQLKDVMKQLKLSQKIQEFMKKLQAMKEFKDIQKLLEKLAKMNEQNQQDGQPNQEIPELSQEEIDQMKQKLSEAIKKLEEQISQMSDEDMKQMLEDYKKALEDALKNGLKSGMCMGLMPGFGFLPGMGMPGMHSWGPSGPGQDNMFENRDDVPLTDKPEDTKAKATMPISTRGQRQDKGDERYIEIRGPVKPGQKSSINYFKVLPSYRKQAENALDKDRIPKEHQKRVKEYFESLNGGGK